MIRHAHPRSDAPAYGRQGSHHQPRRVTGDFNIAVAKFTQVGYSEPKVASIISQQGFRFLDDRAKLITLENVQVAYKSKGKELTTDRELIQRIESNVKEVKS
jgi:hypothetical protein